MIKNTVKGRIFSSPQRRAIVAVFCVIILFATGYGIGVLANINVYLPMKNVPVVQEVTTTVPTTEPTTVPTTVPTTLPPETTTTTEPSTTAAPEEDECCLAGLCDTIKGLLGTVFPCLAEEE